MELGWKEMGKMNPVLSIAQDTACEISPKRRNCSFHSVFTKILKLQTIAAMSNMLITKKKLKKNLNSFIYF